jgi:hypothetical protein
VSVKVLVTGSREFIDYHTIYAALDEIWLQKPSSGMIVIHGDARGADTIADKWAVTRSDTSVVRVPADWTNDGRYAGGPIRNRRMLELGPDLVVAFFHKGAKNKGTTNMVNQAKEAGVEVREYWSTEVD